MKKILALLFPLAILISGCCQEELQNSQLDSLDRRIFTSTFEQNETRTYIENGKLLRWNAGDQISLFDGNTLNRQYQFDGETGDNSGTFSIVNAPYGSGNDLNANYAVYPYAPDVKISESGVIIATLPAVQSYTENSFGLGANTMVAVTKDLKDTFLKFKNVGGFLKLQLYGKNLIIKSITLTGNNNEKLAGKATITPANSQNPTVAMKDDATTSITLDCGEGVKIGSTEETATAFWIVVPPTTFEEGLTITVTEIDGEAFTKSTTNAVVVERNTIKPMAAFEVEIEKLPNNQIWYTSTDGQIVEPYKKADYGANIISNTYENGKGIITFDGDVTSIGNYAFTRCSSLTSVTIPDSVTSIGDYAFEDCCNITSVTIPNRVTEIGFFAFRRCSRLTSVIIINSITTLYNGTFWDCTSLTDVVISEGITMLPPVMFAGCNSLKNIYCKPTNPPAIVYIEGATPNGGIPFPLNTEMKIYVPRNSYNAYTSFTNYVSGAYPDNWFILKSYIEPYDF